MSDLLDELLALEHAGWRSLCDGTGGEFYGELMTGDGRMMLANGVAMSRGEVTAALEQAPPWASYEIEDVSVTAITDDVAALHYTGTGHRDDGDDFVAAMTSVYVRHGSNWKLAHYQQTVKD